MIVPRIPCVMKVALLSSACWLAGPALAESTADEGADTVAESAPAEQETGDIVVTAQRRSENLQDVPISIGVVGGEGLAKQNINTLEAVSVRQASVVIRPAVGGDQIAVRGTSSGFNAGFEQSVATFVDGVYRPRARSSRISLFDVRQIEILRGPQTTYFGANAIAGALNITTRKPGRDFGANGTLFFSPDENEYIVEAGVDVPVAPDMGFRIAGRLTGMDAVTKNARLDERGEQDTKQIRVSMVADPLDTLNVKARFDYARTRNSGDNALEIVDCPPVGLNPAGQCARALALLGDFDDRMDRRNGAGFMDVFNLDLYEGAVTATLDLGWADLIGTTSYQDQKSGTQMEQANFPISSPLGVDALIPLDVREHFRQFSQEIRLQSSNGGPFNYMVGGYFERSRIENNFRIGFFQGPFGAIGAPHYNATDLIVGASDTAQKSVTWSAFATVSYELTEQLKLATSLRYSHVNKKASRRAWSGAIDPFPAGTRAPLLGVQPGPIEGQRLLAPIIGFPLGQYPIDERSDDEWMPSVNVTYEVTPDIMAYASYVHGFKAGGFNLLGGLDTFGPETANAYEGGVKATWFDRRLTTNLAVFRVDYDDLQEAGNIYTPAGAYIAFIGNVAKSRAEGVELETTLRATDELTLNASLGYLQSKYRSYKNAPCSPYLTALAALPGSTVTCPQDLSGVTRANAPKWSGSVAAEYERDVSDTLTATLGGTVYFRSKYYLQTIPEDITSQEKFAKVDLRASLGDIDDKWKLSIIAQNVLDKKTATFAGHTPTAPGTTQRYPDRGRTVGLQLSVNFGGR